MGIYDMYFARVVYHSGNHPLEELLRDKREYGVVSHEVATPIRIVRLVSFQ